MLSSACCYHALSCLLLSSATMLSSACCYHVIMLSCYHALFCYYPSIMLSSSTILLLLSHNFCYYPAIIVLYSATYLLSFLSSVTILLCYPHYPGCFVMISILLCYSHYSYHSVMLSSSFCFSSMFIILLLYAHHLPAHF
jgi:hypothetical protein